MTSTLYVVATPIGNLDDISTRAIHILKTVDVILVEDTRHSQHLLQYYHIKKPLIALHSHNEAKQSIKLIQRLQRGERFALISDAGTPCIHDPGCQLVSQAHRANIKVVPIPGPSALTTALSVAGLPYKPFLFEGFLSPRRAMRHKQLSSLAKQAYTLVFYEAPHRILACLDDMYHILGEQRQASIARELTKQFETLYHGSLIELYHWLRKHPEQCRGEFVIMVTGYPNQKMNELTPEILSVLTTLLEYMPTRLAVQIVHQLTQVPKNKLYQASHR